jgi:hypothetical protein
VAASSIHWLPRPHIITFLMLFIWVQQLENLRREEDTKIWKFPIIMLLWANLHGGFIFGFLAWFAYSAGAVWEKITKSIDGKISKFLYVGAFSLLASFLTPDGWGNWLAVLNNNSQYILQNTAETMSPDFYQSGMIPFLLLLGLTIAIPVLTKAPLHAGQIFLLSGMAMASLLMARNIPLFTVLAIPILSECIKPNKLIPILEKIENRIFLLQFQLKSYWIAISAICLTIFIVNNYSNRQISIMQFNPNVFPVQAMQWLKENPQDGNMFNEFNWGGYLEYSLFPQEKVFLDSQTDFYRESLMREYAQVISAETNWTDILEKYQVEWLIISPNSPLTVVIKSDANWSLLYQDEVAVVYRKSK